MNPPSNDIAAAKNLLRSRIKHQLRAMSRPEYQALSMQASENLLDLIAQRCAGAPPIMLFAPMTAQREIDITPVALALLAQGRVVAAPRVDWESRAITPVRVADWSRDLEDDPTKTRLGLRAPRAGLPEIASASLAIVVVPGLAFDSQGHRLGRGAGFYDRFLTLLPADVLRIGVGFGLQVVENVPIDAHDRRLDAIVTEHRVIWTA